MLFSIPAGLIYKYEDLKPLQQMEYENALLYLQLEQFK